MWYRRKGSSQKKISLIKNKSERISLMTSTFWLILCSNKTRKRVRIWTRINNINALKSTITQVLDVLMSKFIRRKRILLTEKCSFQANQKWKTFRWKTYLRLLILIIILKWSGEVPLEWILIQTLTWKSWVMSLWKIWDNKRCLLKTNKTIVMRFLTKSWTTAMSLSLSKWTSNMRPTLERACAWSAILTN